jgi:hypothetical protein
MGTWMYPAATGGEREAKVAPFAGSQEGRGRARRCLSAKHASLRRAGVHGGTPWAYAKQGLRSVMPDPEFYLSSDGSHSDSCGTNTTISDTVRAAR